MLCHDGPVYTASVLEKFSLKIETSTGASEHYEMSVFEKICSMISTYCEVQVTSAYCSNVASNRGSNSNKNLSKTMFENHCWLVELRYLGQDEMTACVAKGLHDVLKHRACISLLKKNTALLKGDFLKCSRTFIEFSECSEFSESVKSLKRELGSM